MKVSVLNLQAEVVKGDSFEIQDVNQNFSLPHVNYLVNCYQNKNLRQGTASTKNRAEVSGGGAKPYRQKGTGNARRGSNRTPLRPGGGVVFGPKTRVYNSKINNKVFKGSLAGILGSKANDVAILDFQQDTTIKTREIVSFFKKINLNSNEKAFFIIDFNEDFTLEKAIRNLKNVLISSPNFVPTAHLLSASKVFITRSAFGKIEEKVGNK
jgi:large subunit ribosomal protein L4